MAVEQYDPSTEDLRDQPKMTDWAQEPNLRELKKDLEQALPAQRDHASRIETWRDNLNIQGSAKVKVQQGRSSIQPKLIRKQAEWRYSSLSEPFLAAEKLFSVSPVSWEDLEAAEQNEVLLNWQFQTLINKTKFIDTFIHRATDEGTVIVKTGWERETKTVTENVPVYEFYPIVEEDQLMALQEAIQLKTENPTEYLQLADDVKEAVEYTLEHQVPVVAVVTEYEEQEVEKVLVNRPTVEVVENTNLIVDATCKGDLDKAMFIAHTYEVSRGALMRDDRYTNLDQVKWGSSTHTQYIGDEPSVQQITFEEASRQKIEMTEYWGMYDIEGDGHFTPILMCWIGNVIVRLEKNPFPDGKPPFVVVPYMPIKDSIYGEPDGELLEDNQKILGAVSRGIIDMLARSANGQRGTAKGMLDVTNRRRFESGRDYDYNPNMHPQNGFVEHKFPEIPNSAFQMVQMQSTDAESLTGVKTFDDGLNSGSLGKVAAGIRGALDASNRREMAILRRLAQGMADVGAKIISMNQEFLSEEEVVRVTNKEFIIIRREDIQGRFDMTVDISTPGEDEAKASRLEFMLQTIGNNADQNMVNLILSQIAKLRRMPRLAHQIENYQPQPDPLAVEKAQLEIEELKAKVQKANADAMEAVARAHLAQAKAREANSNADKKDLDFVEQETGTSHARDLEKQGEQARANERLELTKGAINAALTPGDAGRANP